ncbi:MAG: glycerol-3-phosphate dehydrogenase/oxidase [Myxococcales bacterium]|nr:glycerol-3-phosphate dehydrogenase/oxidase [Myxococcales bacterium]MCB9651550.1 glycerol-3-phosphate dehydrogenase/oxidase [Deltaproteobacteria bacterium]
MDRAEMLGRVDDRKEPWDLLIVGGGATGLGSALDAASRGYTVLLLEQSDFAKGTSSRSTKLVHGGVRYLQQGNVSLVMEALKERGILRTNAPHLVSDLAFVVPNYDWWETPFYGIGLKVYDMLAGKYGFGKSALLSKEATVKALPTIETEGLRGGVRYYDGQFDDARLAIDIAETAAEQGATLVNYMQVVGLVKDDSHVVSGVEVVDLETGKERVIRAKVVINATGAWTDNLRKMDDPSAKPMIKPSQGVHIVLDKTFLPGDHAIMVPHTSDGRVLFAIPWHHTVVVGTTDTPIENIPLEPKPFEEEIEFILEHARMYLSIDPNREDVKSVFAGIRPLVDAGGEGTTAAISRDHTLHITPSGLLTIAGGKWTTYRKMAEDVIDNAAMLAGLESRPCVTKQLSIHGFHQHAAKFGRLAVYGSDAQHIAQMERVPANAERLHPNLTASVAQVKWAVRYEMARTVEDFLARRTRSLLFDARAALETAPKVARIMAEELGRDEAWIEQQVKDFQTVGKGYVLV